MLKQLMDDGLITKGKIDNRPIQELTPDDYAGFERVHFFAGIGGWDVALNMAGWSNGLVWTGSCPCQPFSSAGKQKGKSDERHLWPVWFRLIRESKPPIVFGEQVSAAIRHGWWDDVADDLEGEGYTARAEIRPACSVGKPHKRDRLWFVADRDGGRCNAASLDREHGQEYHTEPCGTMGNAEHDGRDWRQGREVDGGNVSGGEEGAHCTVKPARAGEPKHVADTKLARLEGFSGHDSAAEGREGQARPVAQGDTLRWVECPDGKARPVEPSIRLLAHGVQHRAPILHALGNAIVPAVAAEFIKENGVKNAPHFNSLTTAAYLWLC